MYLVNGGPLIYGAIGGPLVSISLSHATENDFRVFIKRRVKKSIYPTTHLFKWSHYGDDEEFIQQWAFESARQWGRAGEKISEK